MDKKRAKVVELAGLPAAGKSTIIDILEKKMRDEGINCRVVPTASSISPISNYKTEWTFDIWSLCRTVQQLIEVSKDTDNKLILMERGLIDSICWLEFFKNSGQVEQSVLETIKEFVFIPEWFNRIDLVIVLQIKFETALARGRETGKITNSVMYTHLRKAYDSTLKNLQLKKHYSNIVVYETDNLSPSDMYKFSIEQLNFIDNTILGSIK
ncbi:MULTISPECIES: ATP-binding protein [Nostocales]|uniref:NadR/Ttd14 AAA domain-containing protein n=2 Tax=Tolypothrix TaxID=111782 RepID=A0A0C1NB19_9CYAN